MIHNAGEPKRYADALNLFFGLNFFVTANDNCQKQGWKLSGGVRDLINFTCGLNSKFMFMIIIFFFSFDYYYYYYFFCFFWLKA